MCGIAGIYNFKNDRPVSGAVIEAMTESLKHRGPDDAGFFLSGALALGMRRLSIIDLEGGAQPIGSEDGSIQVVCNGEIYNHPELRHELEAKGHRFRTRSDVEVIAHGYEEWGVDILQKLNGMFAFALWDAPRKRLLLARDRIGIKPLYYAETASGIVFASELRGLRQHPGLGDDLDPVALRQYLAWEYVPAPRTPFIGMSKLRPAHLLLAEPAGMVTRTYWRLQGGTPVSSVEEAKEGLWWHLKRSVKMQLVADVPVGAFLSGGLDSSGLVATLREVGNNQLHTFSIGFPEASFNETHHARRVADFVGTRHVDEELRPNCLDLIEEVGEHLDEPFADNSILPTYLLSRLARRHVKVVLSGDGGDELFGGYDHYKAHRIAEWYVRLPRALRTRLARHVGLDGDATVRKHGSWRRRLRRLEEALALPPQLEHARWMVRTVGALQGDLLSAGIDGTDSNAWMERWSEAFSHSPFDEPLTRQLEVDLHTFLADDILWKVDRASMAVSLEARVPYLDHELVEYAFRIPARWKLRWLQGKWILRKALKNRLPASILRRRKSGFSVPVGSWLRGELRPLLGDLLSPGRLQRQGIFQPPAVSRMQREHLEGLADHSRALWTLIMFQIWWDRHAAGPKMERSERSRKADAASQGAAA